jgi:lysozyme family protein
MTEITFHTCVNFVLSPAVEGGLSDHPADPGGRTNMGVTQRRLDSVRISHPELQVPQKVDELNREQAISVYRVCEWAWIQGDRLPGPLALLMFDTAVNQGATRAVEFLQSALQVKRDGVLGPITIAAANASNIRMLCAEYAARRGFHYATLDKLDDVFGLGWMRRLFACYTLAISEAV